MSYQDRDFIPRRGFINLAFLGAGAIALAGCASAEMPEDDTYKLDEATSTPEPKSPIEIPARPIAVIDHLPANILLASRFDLTDIELEEIIENLTLGDMVPNPLAGFNREINKLLFPDDEERRLGRGGQILGFKLFNTGNVRIVAVTERQVGIFEGPFKEVFDGLLAGSDERIKLLLMCYKAWLDKIASDAKPISGFIVPPDKDTFTNYLNEIKSNLDNPNIAEGQKLRDAGNLAMWEIFKNMETVEIHAFQLYKHRDPGGMRSTVSNILGGGSPGVGALLVRNSNKDYEPVFSEQKVNLSTSGLEILCIRGVPYIAVVIGDEHYYLPIESFIPLPYEDQESLLGPEPTNPYPPPQ